MKMKALMVVNVAAVLLTSTSAHACGARIGDFKPIPVSEFLKDSGRSKQWRGPLTLQEVEAESMRHIRSDRHIPQLPFGYANAAWLQFKKQVQPSDRFFGLGHAGYALVCDNLVVGVFTVLLN